MVVKFYCGDSLQVLKTLPSESHQCCVTSPPYYRMRDYGSIYQIGHEETPEKYARRLVDVFREVRRILKKDGVLWLNIGDGYCPRSIPPKYKRSDLYGIPWLVAFKLREDGWYLRSAVIWHKPNPMPESMKNRPTQSYENVFLFSREEKYYCDMESIKEPATNGERFRGNYDKRLHGGRERTLKGTANNTVEKRNVRNVWILAPRNGESLGHYAVMPDELARRCILTGSRKGQYVLDPFGGVGTTGLISRKLRRNCSLIELMPESVSRARQRIYGGE